MPILSPHYLRENNMTFIGSVYIKFSNFNNNFVQKCTLPKNSCIALS